MKRSILILALAHIAHEANRAYCRSIGDDSQPSWDDAPEWQRESAINGVEGVLNGNTPEQSHESWMAEKVATGWVYGEVKDPEAKTHPCMVPYSELPEQQKVKDHLYVSVVKASAGALAPEPLEQELSRIREAMAKELPPITAKLSEALGAQEANTTVLMPGLKGTAYTITRPDGTVLSAGVVPTVGRDVHYLSYGTPGGEYKPAHRAAKITDVRESDQFGFEVRACVFNPEGLFFTGWTHFDESATQGGTVHWPERV